MSSFKELKGRIIVNGQVVQNLAMDTYRRQISLWLAGGTPANPRHIALGQGTVKPTVGDSSLGSEIFRKVVASRFQRGDDSARLTAIFSVDEPPITPGSTSIAIREVGLFDAGEQTISNDGFETWTLGSPDSWATVSGGSMSQESGTANIYEQGYSLLFSRTSGTPNFYQNLTFATSMQSKKHTLRAMVKAGSANMARIFIDDGSGTANSSYHSGGGGHELLSVQRTLGTAATKLKIGGEIGTAGGAAGSAWFDWVRCVQDGNLWARTLFSLDKESDEPLAFIWELYFERQNEEGTMPFTGYDSEVISQGTASAGSLSPSKYNPTGAGVAQEAFLTIENYNLRYYYHGGTPGSATGHIINAPGNISVQGNDNMANLRFLGVGGTSVVTVTYLR